MLQVSIYQNTGENADSVTLNTTSKIELDLKASRANVSKAVGTICSEVFRTMDLYKACGSTFVKCNAPTHIRMTIAGMTIDTGATLHREAAAGLRVGHTPKAKRRFAQRLFHMVNFMLHTVEVSTVDEVTAALDAQIAAALKA